MHVHHVHQQAHHFRDLGSDAADASDDVTSRPETNCPLGVVSLFVSRSGPESTLYTLDFTAARCSALFIYHPSEGQKCCIVGRSRYLWAKRRERNPSIPSTAPKQGLELSGAWKAWHTPASPQPLNPSTIPSTPTSRLPSSCSIRRPGVQKPWDRNGGMGVVHLHGHLAREPHVVEAQRKGHTQKAPKLSSWKIPIVSWGI